MSKATKSSYLEGAMISICELMREIGTSKEVAVKKLSAAIDATYLESKAKISDSRKISMLADVCARWHLESQYVDSEGHPRPLRWNGRTGELIKLARSVVGRRAAVEVVETLISRRLVRRSPDGRWLPKSRVVAPVGQARAQVQRSSQMIDRLLRTITYNSGRRYRGDVLLEVMAQVPRLPEKQVPNFKKFAKAQGLIFAKAVDDWLEARSIRRDKLSTIAATEAGVVAFAFVTPRAASAARRYRR